MTALFKKLNFKEHKAIVALNVPQSFELELAEMARETKIVKEIKSIKEIEFILCFVSTQKEVDKIADEIKSKLVGDVILWMCYPKGTSKKYTCDFNRDTGWEKLGNLNLEPVRMVAIDEDWSALRFRKVEFIKTITRRESYALTKTAKSKTTQKGK
jgi:hypothetical protein